jgi:integrase
MVVNNSTAPNQLRKPTKPKKPYHDFPLFPHATKRWAKKIKGRLVYFGPWDDPQGALNKYLDQRDALYTGRKPMSNADMLTVKKLCNKFLSFKQGRVASKELTQRTWSELYVACERVIRVFGGDRPVVDLTAEDFEKLRAKLSETMGPVRLSKEVQMVRTLFKYGYDAGHIAAPVRFGPAFVKPSKKTLRLHRAAQGPRMFEAAEIHRMLDAAGTQLRAMILLGVNCGFGNHDCGTLPLSALDMENGWLNFPRPKTGVPRRCKLWSETVAALRKVLAARKPPNDPAHAGLAFITKRGGSWAKHDKDNPVSKETRKILDMLSINGRRNFYALRHTFETIGGDTRDQIAVNAIMGHVDNSMAANYRERIDDERLAAVADHVRSWLFSPGKSQTDDKGS